MAITAHNHLEPHMNALVLQMVEPGVASCIVFNLGYLPGARVQAHGNAWGSRRQGGRAWGAVAGAQGTVGSGTWRQGAQGSNMFMAGRSGGHRVRGQGMEMHRVSQRGMGTEAVGWGGYRADQYGSPSGSGELCQQSILEEQATQYILISIVDYVLCRC